MEPNTRVNGWELKDMDTEYKYGLTTQNTRENGSTIRLTVEVNFTTLMVMFTMESGRTTKLTEEASIPMQMERYMTDSGLTTNNTGLESSLGQMVRDTKANMSTERKRAKELSTLLTDPSFEEISKEMKSTGMEFTNGLMEKNMKDLGSTTRCVEEEL